MGRKATTASTEEDEMEYYDAEDAGGKAASKTNTGKAAAADEVEYYDAGDETVEAGSGHRRGSLQRVWSSMKTADGRATAAAVVAVASLGTWLGHRWCGARARRHVQAHGAEVHAALEHQLFTAMLRYAHGRGVIEAAVARSRHGAPAGNNSAVKADAVSAVEEQVRPPTYDSSVTPIGTPTKIGLSMPKVRSRMSANTPQSYVGGGDGEEWMRERHGDESAVRELRLSPTTPIGVEGGADATTQMRASSRHRSATPHAFATVCSSDDFVLGAVVLGASLRRLHPGVPLVCAVVASNVSPVHRAVLTRVGWDVRLVPSFLSDLEWYGFLGSRRLSNKALQRQMQNGSAGSAAGATSCAPESTSRPGTEWERATFDKIRLWEFTEFDKLLFIDADAVAIAPLDELFHYDELTAAKSGFGLFNSGVMLLRPDRDTFAALKNCLLREEWRAEYRRGYPFPYGDQPLLNYFFQDAFEEVPAIYNTTCQRNVHPRHTRIIHYNGPIKPWHVHRHDNFRAGIIWRQRRWKHWYREYDDTLHSCQSGSVGHLTERCYWG
ncbi:hypothetical protein CDCA_CDCA17G4381 [Cyanidium caldarium]|uniref:Uncharacterized protein n=1 Tax=Cyanidium caldarium TaxID=2771 RepID=A0AAV9J1V5_CYACA|nr:hypothetical protein CDCA_CDCA17G4381 [Cyanidium caldarium]